jgi:hypothetical protein
MRVSCTIGSSPFCFVQPNFDLEQTLNHIKTSNDIDRNEKISLFQRLLEIVIRHALRKKTADKTMKKLDVQLMGKPGSE